MSQRKSFSGSFTQQEPISEEAVSAALEVLRSGRLHRYNSAGNSPSEVSQLEREFAQYLGVRYCLACASGGYSMHIALRAAGIRPGDQILTNAFTLAPVPGAIVNAAGTPVYVDTNKDLVIDIDDLARKIEQSGAQFLLLSHMRGHLSDMDAIVRLTAEHGITLIEDCAHTMGAQWDGRMSGTFGLAGCFSAQTYKHLNAGEGGFLTSDDPAFMARAIIMSGSYMLYERHLAAPDPKFFADVRLDIPNFSGRMDNLRAAILRPQLKQLDSNVERWNQRYTIIQQRLSSANEVYLPTRPASEKFVGSSIQFLVPGFSTAQAQHFLSECASLGVELKWFGNPEPVGFTSSYKTWRYVSSEPLAQTDKVLATLFDMRIPLTFSLEDCEHIATLIVGVLDDMGCAQEESQ